MWLNCLLVVFLSSNNLVYSLHFEDADTDFDIEEEEWDSMESFTLSPDYDDDDDDSGDGDGFMTQFKAGLPDSSPSVQVKASLPDSSPVQVKAGLPDSSPVQVNAGLPDSSPVQVNAGLPDSSPVQVNARLPDSSPVQVKADLPDSSPVQVNAGLPDSSPYQVKAGLLDLSPVQVNAGLPDSSPYQVKAGLPDSSPVQVKAVLPDSSPVQVNAGLPDSSPVQVNARLPDSSPVQVKAGLPDSSPDQVKAGLLDSSPVQVKDGLPDSSPVQVKAGFLDSSPVQVKAGFPDSSPVQVKAGLLDSSPVQVKTGLSDSKPVQDKDDVLASKLFSVKDGLSPKIFQSGLLASKPVRPLTLPGSVRIQASMLYKELFTPERNSRPVPPLLKSILLAETANVKHKKPVSDQNMEVICYMDRMHVKVRRSLFTDPSAWKNLKLGTCAVNKASDTHYQFLYYLKGCGIQRGEDADRVTYSNTLHYMPDATELIVRELPFRVPIQCSYTKFHRSYKIGFLPQVAGGVLYKTMGPTRTGPTIAAMDASWNPPPVGQSFDLSKPVCFEAKSPSRGTRERLYVNRCFVTSKPSPSSKDKYSIVENYGCLVDSKNSALTKFYTSDDKMTVRLCVGAFLFKNMVSQPQSIKTMFLHCELDFGPETPTPSAKSCMYNTRTKKWTELYGDASVCNCCASTCPGSPRMSGKSMITSESWKLKMGRETSSPEEPMLDFPSADHDLDFSWESDYY